MRNPRIVWLGVFVWLLADVALVLAEPSLLLPDPRKTPGDVLTTDATVVCQRGYSDTVRHVPQSLKNLIYKLYGITTHAPQEYEVDHLVPIRITTADRVVILSVAKNLTLNVEERCFAALNMTCATVIRIGS